MYSNQNRLEELISLSRRLAEPGDLVILGEGNTSTLIDDESFYVKVSGTQLGTATAESFVAVSKPRIMQMLAADKLSDAEIKEGLTESVCDNSGRKPSVETMFHAYLLDLPGINFVAHTHPTAVNAILCSTKAEKLVQGRLFPDEIVCCGPEPVFIKYEDPGHLLAKRIMKGCTSYMERWGEPPRSILMQNHGLIALGKTAAQVEATTLMWNKTAQVLTGAAILGGVNYLSEQNVSRIYTRDDEKEREKQLFRTNS